jgi:hypothetical protein
MNFASQTQLERVEKAFATPPSNLQFQEVKFKSSENHEVKKFLTTLQKAYTVTKKSRSAQFK